MSTESNENWDGGLLAFSLYNKQQSSNHLRGLNSGIVALYDPMGGGPWGKKKKRSLPENFDFDYEGDDL